MKKHSLRAAQFRMCYSGNTKMILCRVKVDNLTGYIHPDGSWQITPAFPRSADFGASGCPVLNSESQRWELIDEHNKSVGKFPPRIRDVFSQTGDFFPAGTDAGWGFFDADCKQVIEPRFFDPAAGPVGSAIMKFDKCQTAILAPLVGPSDTLSGRPWAIGIIARGGDWIIEPNPKYRGYGDGALLTDCRDEPDAGDPPFGFDLRSYGRTAGPNCRIDFRLADFVRAPTSGLIPIARILGIGRDRELIEYTPLTKVSGNDVRWGFASSQGIEVIAPQFDDVKTYREALCPVRVNGKWGYIDEKGAMAIEPQFKDANAFSLGLAAAQCKEGSWGFIQRSGDWVILPQFESVGCFSSTT
jgi:hypothetical protein